jgi:hypothetical protein
MRVTTEKDRKSIPEWTIWFGVPAKHLIHHSICGE